MLFLFLLACSGENGTLDEISLPEGKVRLAVDLRNGNYNKPAKAFSASLSEETLTDVWAFCFDAPNGVSSESAVLKEMAEVNIDASGYSVMLSLSENPVFVLFVANAGEVIKKQMNQLAGKTYKAIIENELYYGNSISGGTALLSDPQQTPLFLDPDNHTLRTPLPMYGHSAILDNVQKGTTIGSVLLKRSVSKLMVDASAAASTNGFTLTGVSMINLFNKGLIVPEGITDIPVNKSSRVNYGIMVNNQLTPLISPVSGNNTLNIPLYFFRTQQNLQVIIAGHFTGSTVSRYYKVEIPEDKLLCNISYVLNIVSASNKGYATMQEAINAQAGTGLLTEVLVLDDSHELTSDGEYYMGLSNSVFLLCADGVQNDVTVSTVTTNAFGSGVVPPAAKIEILNSQNVTLVPGQTISSNSTDIKLNFNDQPQASCIIRITIGSLTKEITVNKQVSINSNFSEGSSGILIAENAIEAHVVNGNNNAGLASAALSSERNLSMESATGINVYAFINSTNGPETIEIRALTNTGKTILVRNAGNNSVTRN